ncbi:MAG: hypothetical protein MNPFHGCM_02434 [Gemmatimonadaceae bacterium]|nr:hypothetical protein [Gemmatimonadaceae bacterium]
MKTFRSPNGTWWGVRVQSPSHSSALVLFMHPDGATSRRDRYAWLNASTAEASDPTARLKPDAVLASLDEPAIARLFRRSMPVDTRRPSYIVS